jgi:hypothetical protein
VIGLAASALLAPLSFIAASNGEAKQEILLVEQQYIQAHLNRDTSTLDSILADEFTFKDTWGRGATKARRLALLEDPNFSFEAINTDNVQVEVNGESAVLTGEAFVVSHNGYEELISPSYNYERQYEKRQGRWQIVSVRVRR